MTPIETVEEIYAAFEAKDLDRVLELISEDCVIDQDGRLPYGGHYEGHEGATAFMINLIGTIQSTVTQLALFEADDYVWQYGRTAGTVVANGAPFDIAEIHRWTVRDGRAVAAHFSIDTPALLAAIEAPGGADDHG